MIRSCGRRSACIATFPEFRRGLWWRHVARATAIAVTLSVAALPSSATFPGKNGRIAYVSYGDFGDSYNKIFLTDHGQLTFGTIAQQDFSPAFSPDGSKLVFVRQTLAGGQYFQRILIVQIVDGATSQVASSESFPGINAYLALSSPTFSADGERISFVVHSSDDRSGIWTVGGAGGLTQTVREPSPRELNWSSVGDELVYTCFFRRGPDNRPLLELCTHDEHTGITRQLPIEVPGLLIVTEPRWMPDGEKIVFAAYSTPTEGTHTVERRDIYSINANGTGLHQITNSGPEVCPETTSGASVATYAFDLPRPSPDGSFLLVQKRPVAVLGGSACAPWTYPAIPELHIINLSTSASVPPLVVTPGPLIWGTDWEPVPADLTVKIDDGHLRPLDGLKVQVRNPETGAIVYENPIHNGQGTYIFEDVPAGDYVVRTTLVDFKNEPGYTPAFEIRHDQEWSEAAWAEYRVTVPATGGKVVRLPFEEQLFVPPDAPPLIDSSVAQTEWDRLDDMAAIYYELQRYVAWVKRTLTDDTGESVVVTAFATTDPGTTNPFYNPKGAFYLGSDPFADPPRPQPIIALGTELSRFEFRDGSYGRLLGDEGPENAEWHEFNHHLWFTFVDTEPYPEGFCVGENHQGYMNADTCDSLFEGFASFLAAAAARDIDGATDSFYDGYWDLEAPLKAWSSYTSRNGERTYEEDMAVAALLWDLHDTKADRLDTDIIAQNGSHEPVTYTDEQSESLVDLWARLVSAKPLTVDALRASYGMHALSIDLDEDGFNDIAPIDQVFLMHGFFPIDLDETITSSHRTYHYDVDYAQRTAPTAERNAVVGWSSHRTFAANGTVLNTFIPRFHMETDPNANVAIDVRDASGTPLSGAEIDLVIEYPGQQQSASTRQLGSGADNLLPLRLPSYFDYLLPEDAPLPECDPANDVQVTVTVHSKLNGYVSPDAPSFDNCTYQRAIAAAAGPAALSFTTTFPEDSTAPESTIDTVPSDALVNGATTGFWTVRLSCDDPADSGFAAGCARIEYRLDAGSFTVYERSVRVTGVGPHTFEYRSVDAAGNEEAVRFVALDIAAGPPPTIASFSPASGVVGTSVAITGTDLNGATGVTFNDVTASYAVVSATQINATVPAGATTGPIAVTTQYGTAMSGTSFTVIPPPAITDFSPPFGQVGAVVTISGTSFDGASSLTFNGTAAAFVVNSSTQITTMVPTGATTGPLRVTTPGGAATSSTNFVVTVGPPPTITSFTPTSGKVGTAVTIKGESLANASSVTFNGVSAAFKYKGSSISATVPAGASTGPITVTTPGGWGTSATSFAVIPPPTIAGFSPASGAPGSTVTITGTGFTGARSVKLNGSNARFTVLSPTAITATVPNGAKSGPISVTTAGGTATSAASFTVVK